MKSHSCWKKKNQFRERMFLRKKDGGDLLFDVQAAEVMFEGKTVYLASTHDVTELAKTEEALLQTNKQLRELTIHLQDIREEERKHISREIHDELGQQLTALKLDLSWIAKKMKTQEQVIFAKIKSSLDVVNSTIQKVRRLATQLRPAMLDELGLAEAIRWQTNEFLTVPVLRCILKPMWMNIYFRRIFLSAFSAYCRSR
jgi:signal transduction histidine kinase